MNQGSVGRRLKLRDLHTFAAVARRGSIGKAALDLARTQPAVSKVINDMEQNLGVRLFDRTPQGVVPTRYGTALLRRATALLDDLGQALNELEHLANPTVGELKIGCSEGLMAGFMPAAIDRINRQYPGVHFHVAQASTDPLLRALREREVDLVVVRIKPDPEEDLEKEILFDDPIAVVAGRDSVWSRRRRVALSELAAEPWGMVPHDVSIGPYMAANFRAEGVSYPTSGVRCTALQMQVSLARTGRYLAVLPTSFLKFSTERSTLKILPVRLDIQPPPIGVATLKHRTISPVANVFVGMLREVAKPFRTRP
jgi:DNA-binding transcriptional LysR family regulator